MSQTDPELIMLLPQPLPRLDYSMASTPGSVPWLHPVEPNVERLAFRAVREKFLPEIPSHMQEFAMIATGN